MSFKEKEGLPKDYFPQQCQQLFLFLFSQGRLRLSLNVEQLSDGCQLDFLYVLCMSDGQYV